ncbi:LysR family transcriptional regulator [Kiloniella majae]|uniref:LysR family transcriptional regulator n=1 Tax=Kiloniella majae TaxID=1938558 RepID=UPI000A277E71|nr:LysR family transcriptional regulator [Kiloniella majae]
MIDLNKLRTFTVVADEGSITKAAERLYRTQPAISAQLKDVEDETELVLFERKNSKIYLTKEGKCLFEYARERIDEIDAVVNCLRNNRQNLEGTIRLGVHFELTSFFIPEIVHKFKVEHPRVRLEIFELDHDALEAGLLANDIDLGLVTALKKTSFFETHPFFTFQRHLVASHEYLSRVSPELRYEDIFDLEIIASSNLLSDYKSWLKINQQSQLFKQVENITKLVTVKDAEAMRSLIKKGAGIGFYDDLGKSQEQDVVRVFPESNPITINIEVARRKTRTQNVLLDEFYDFLSNNSLTV